MGRRRPGQQLATALASTRTRILAAHPAGPGLRQTSGRARWQQVLAPLRCGLLKSAEKPRHEFTLSFSQLLADTRVPALSSCTVDPQPRLYHRAQEDARHAGRSAGPQARSFPRPIQGNPLFSPGRLARLLGPLIFLANPSCALATMAGVAPAWP